MITHRTKIYKLFPWGSWFFVIGIISFKKKSLPAQENPFLPKEIVFCQSKLNTSISEGIITCQTNNFLSKEMIYYHRKQCLVKENKILSFWLRKLFPVNRNCFPSKKINYYYRKQCLDQERNWRVSKDFLADICFWYTRNCLSLWYSKTALFGEVVLTLCGKCRLNISYCVLIGNMGLV